jgi:hypothetical protein
MITKEQKIEIFENMFSSLRKKLIQSNTERLSEKYRRLPLD